VYVWVIVSWFQTPACSYNDVLLSTHIPAWVIFSTYHIYSMYSVAVQFFFFMSHTHLPWLLTTVCVHTWSHINKSIPYCHASLSRAMSNNYFYMNDCMGVYSCSFLCTCINFSKIKKLVNKFHWFIDIFKTSKVSFKCTYQCSDIIDWNVNYIQTSINGTNSKLTAQLDFVNKCMLY